MWPDWVSNPGPLTYESGALLTATRPGVFSGETSVVAQELFKVTVKSFVIECTSTYKCQKNPLLLPGDTGIIC